MYAALSVNPEKCSSKQKQHSLKHLIQMPSTPPSLLSPRALTKSAVPFPIQARRLGHQTHKLLALRLALLQRPQTHLHAQ